MMSSDTFWLQQKVLSKSSGAYGFVKFSALSAGDKAPAGEPQQGRSVFEARRLQAERSALVARLAQQPQP